MLYPHPIMVDRIVVGPMHTNAYLFSEWKKECIILDPGGDPELIISRLNAINMKPRGILCTHGHIDHICAAGQLQEHYRERGIEIKIAVHKDDIHYFGSGSADLHVNSFVDSNTGDRLGYDEAIGTIPEADTLIDEGDQLFDADLVAIHTPGHTPGSICLYSESQGFVFSGDTLLFEGIGRTDLPEADAEELIASIRNKLLVLPPETRIFPGHGPYTNLEREIKNNPYFS